jgi:hypothetical protein
MHFALGTIPSGVHHTTGSHYTIIQRGGGIEGGRERMAGAREGLREGRSGGEGDGGERGWREREREDNVSKIVFSWYANGHFPRLPQKPFWPA